MARSTQSLWSDLVATTSQQTSRRLRLITALRKHPTINHSNGEGLIKLTNWNLRGRELKYVVLLDKVRVHGRPKRWVLRVPSYIGNKTEATAWTFGLASHAWVNIIKET